MTEEHVHTVITRAIDSETEFVHEKLFELEQRIDAVSALVDGLDKVLKRLLTSYAG